MPLVYKPSPNELQKLLLGYGCGKCYLFPRPPYLFSYRHWMYKLLTFQASLSITFTFYHFVAIANLAKLTLESSSSLLCYVQNAIWNNVLSQKLGFFVMCGCFFGKYSNLSANEGCLTHFVGKRGLKNSPERKS